MKATLLEQMKRDYIHIKHTKTVTRQQVERQEEVQHITFLQYNLAAHYMYSKLNVKYK